MDASFTSALRDIQPRLSEMRCRIVPSLFDAEDDELLAFPLPLEWQWISCERALRLFKPTGVMMRLPLFWQSETPLHTACENAGTSIFVNEPENMPVGAVALQSGAVDTVVTTAADADAFAQYLLEKEIPPAKNWLIIHRIDAGSWSIPNLLREKDISVAQEVHLFPFVPVLVQCSECIAQKKDFHISDEFSWEKTGTSVSVTGRNDAPFPIVKLQLPPVLQGAGTCPCGAARFE